LINEERCEDVQLEQQTYCGVHSKTCEKEKAKKEAEEKKKREAEGEKDEL